MSGLLGAPGTVDLAREGASVTIGTSRPAPIASVARA